MLLHGGRPLTTTSHMIRYDMIRYAHQRVACTRESNQRFAYLLAPVLICPSMHDLTHSRYPLTMYSSFTQLHAPTPTKITDPKTTASSATHALLAPSRGIAGDPIVPAKHTGVRASVRLSLFATARRSTVWPHCPLDTSSPRQQLVTVPAQTLAITFIAYFSNWFPRISTWTTNSHR